MEILIAYSHRGHEDSQKISSDASALSHHYNGEKLSFMSGHFSRYLGTIKRTVELPNFEKSIVLKSTNKFLVIMKESLFLVKKYPALWALQEFQMDANYILITIVTSNKLMKI